MIQNKLKRLLKEGKTLIGVFLIVPSPELVEIIGEAGFDFVIIDLEHGSIGIDSAKTCVLAADATAIAPVIRVADNSQTLIEQALDLGVQNVVIPHINTGEEAKQAVQAAKYAPLGNRGYCPFTRGGRYGIYGRGSSYTDQANKETMVILLVEGVAGIENIDSILSVEGVDVILVGPADLSASMGLMGQWDHTSVQQHVNTVIEKARAKGIPAMTHLAKLEDAKTWVNKGVSILSCSTDTEIFHNACVSLKNHVLHALE